MNFFDEAVSVHLQWKFRLQHDLATIGAAVDAAAVGHDGRCDLGAWINGEGACYRHLEEYHALHSAHAAFHRRAALLAGLHAGTPPGEAGRCFVDDAELAEASSRTVLAIGALRRAIDRQRARREDAA